MTVVALVSAGGSPPAAYAVTQNPDGSVTLSLDEVLGVEPVDERLAQLGVPVVVAKMEAGCDEHGEPVRFPSGRAFPEMIETVKTGSGLAGLTWVIRPSLIPSGDTLRIAVQRDPRSPIPALGAQFGLFRGQAPSCALPGTFDGLAGPRNIGPACGTLWRPIGSEHWRPDVSASTHESF